MEPIERAQRNLRRSEHRFRLFLVFVILVVATFTAYMIIRVSNRLDQQTTFIIRYLQCVGQVPQEKRGAVSTNKCFEEHAPREFLR